MRYFLFFLLLLTGTINHEILVGGVNVGYVDFIWISILMLSVFKRDTQLPSKFTKIFLVLLGYYIFLTCYSYSSGATIHEIGGRIRNLYLYPLMFFAGYILTDNMKAIHVYFKLIKIYIVVAVSIGLLTAYYPLVYEFAIYQGIDESDYFMLVHFGTGLLAGLVLVHQVLICIDKNRMKSRDVVLIVVFAIAIIGTLNRSTNISVFASLLITIAYIAKYRGKSKQMVKVGGLLLIGFTVIFVASFWFTKTGFYEDNVYSRLQRATAPIVAYDNYFNRSISTRIARVVTGLSIWWQESPIIGKGWIGLGAVHFVDPIGGTYIYTLYSSTFMSYYVETLVRTGIIGFIIMIMLFLNVFKGLSASGLNQKGNIEVFSIRMYLLSCMIYATVNYNLNGDSPFIACFFYILGIGIHHNEFAKDQRVAKRRVSFQQAF
jgi:hypothetical protein